MDRKPQCKKFSSSNEDIKLFPTKLVRNVDFRDEVGEAIDNELKLISNDSKYLDNSNPLTKAKTLLLVFKKAHTSMKSTMNAGITIKNTCRPEINYTDKITRKLKRKSESFCETWKMTGGKTIS